MNLENKGDHNKMSDKKSNWIWLPTWTAEDKENPALVLFRKEVEITGTPIAGKITISADSRYKLYVNGELAGEHKNSGYTPFTVNISEYIKEGKI